MNISCAGSCVQCAYCILCLIWAIWFKCVSFWDRLCKLYKSLWQIKYGKIIDCYQSIAINKEWSNVPNLLKLLTINFIMKKNQENPWFNKWCFFSLTKRNNILIDANTHNEHIMSYFYCHKTQKCTIENHHNARTLSIEWSAWLVWVGGLWDNRTQVTRLPRIITR